MVKREINLRKNLRQKRTAMPIKNPAQKKPQDKKSRGNIAISPAP